MRGQFKPNWKMEAGTDWHRTLEGQRPITFRFNAEAIEKARALIGPGLWEVQGSMEISIRGQPVLLTGKCDHINGLVIQDQKTKFSTPDAKDYEHSLQWRVYLTLFAAERFQYNLWCFGDPKVDNLLTLNDVVSFSFNRYPGMEQDVFRWLSAFVDWADSRNLTKYLDTEKRHEQAA